MENPNFILPYNKNLDLVIVRLNKINISDPDINNELTKIPIDIKGITLTRALTTKSRNVFFVLFKEPISGGGIVFPLRSTSVANDIYTFDFEVLGPDSLLTTDFTEKEILQIQEWLNNKHKDLLPSLVKIFGPTELDPELEHNIGYSGYDSLTTDMVEFLSNAICFRFVSGNPYKSLTPVKPNIENLQNVLKQRLNDLKEKQTSTKSDYQKVVSLCEQIADIDRLFLPCLIRFLEYILEVHQKDIRNNVMVVSPTLKLMDDTGNVAKYAVYSALEDYFRYNDLRFGLRALYELFDDLSLTFNNDNITQ